MSLSVLIPIRDPEPSLPKVLKRVRQIRDQTPELILEVLEERSGFLCEARRSLAERARASFILNLDADTIVPLEYPARALTVLKKDPFVGAVALNYRPKPQNHLAFGTSIMRRDVMLEWYDWKGSSACRACECQYMWRRLDAAGWILATLPLVAEHKKEIPSPRGKTGKMGHA